MARSADDLYGQAIREIDDPKSEICAFLDFRDALGDHFGVARGSWQREPHDPPDYYLWSDGQKIGVEVTTLTACQPLFKANAAMQRVHAFLEKKTAGMEVTPGAEIRFEPDSPQAIPATAAFTECSAPLFDCLRAPPASSCKSLSIPLPGGKVWVRWLGSPSSGVHVVAQEFFLNAEEKSWPGDINQSVMQKVKKYSRRPKPLYKPCWLLLNLKPYLPGNPANLMFLANGVQIDEPEPVRAVFNRVYGLTNYIPDAGNGPPCPVRLLLPRPG